MQNPFSFRLLPFNSIALGFLILASCFLLPSCSFNPNYQGKGSDFLQGEWKQDSVERQKLLVSYSLNSFKFSCDSFYLKVASVSKVNYGADSCMKSGHWTEYVRGTYEQKGDTVNLKGFFCNPDFSLKKEGGCFRFGAYEERFTVSSKSDTGIVLMPFSSTMAVKLRLLKRIPCVAKPL